MSLPGEGLGPGGADDVSLITARPALVRCPCRCCVFLLVSRYRFLLEFRCTLDADVRVLAQIATFIVALVALFLVVVVLAHLLARHHGERGDEDSNDAANDDVDVVIARLGLILVAEAVLGTQGNPGGGRLALGCAVRERLAVAFGQGVVGRCGGREEEQEEGGS